MTLPPAGQAMAARPEGVQDRLIAFVRALRRAEIPVSPSEAMDAARAIITIDLLDREGLRAALAACCCKRAAHRNAYDSLFELYWPARLGDGVMPHPFEGEVGPDGEGGEAAELPLEDLRELLKQLLLDGDVKGLRDLARQAVSQLGRVDAGSGRQSWFGYRVMRQMDPTTLISALLDAMLGDEERGGLAEQVARTTITERIRAFQEAVDAEIRRRVAEERGRDAVEKHAVAPLAEQVDFLRATREDLKLLRREVQPLARRLATRLTAKRRLGDRGRLDFRRTVRSSLAYGGVPADPIFKPHKPHKPELVVLCDVSGSVASFAHFTLLLTHALREQFAKVRAFAFIDTMDEITRFFGPDADLADVMARVQHEADLVWLDGHSDYGHSFEVFEERWADAITPRTSLLILGDGRTNHRHPGTQALHRITAMAKHTYWLNPEPQAQWGTGDSATRTYEPHVDDMVECRNAAQLTEFVTRILPVG
jgi:uncharacterized protein with von Willebrand factor type A (vWA) domain